MEISRSAKLGLFDQIKEDFNVPKHNDPALNSKLEIIFNYPGVWAIINYRVANKLYVNGFKKIARIYSGISQFLTNIDIHPAATIGRRVFIDHETGVVIGENTVIEEMAKKGIACNVHYKPLPMLTAYKNMGFDIDEYPNAYHYFENTLTLPLHTKLSDEGVNYVIDSLKDIIEENNK